MTPEVVVDGLFSSEDKAKAHCLHFFQFLISARLTGFSLWPWSLARNKHLQIYETSVKRSQHLFSIPQK